MKVVSRSFHWHIKFQMNISYLIEIKKITAVLKKIHKCQLFKIEKKLHYTAPESHKSWQIFFKVLSTYFYTHTKFWIDISIRIAIKNKNVQNKISCQLTPVSRKHFQLIFWPYWTSTKKLEMYRKSVKPNTIYKWT